MSGTFQAIWNLVSLIPLIVFLWLWLKQVRPRLRGTTLTGSGNWLIVAVVTWILTAAWQSPLDLSGQETLPGLASRLNYLSLTLWLTPMVAVLGAKRPGVRVWNVFVVVPMLIMLNWPAFSAERDVLWNSSLDLEAPALMGFFVVLLMVLGNYFGTIFTFPALLFCGALGFALCEFSHSLPDLNLSALLARSCTSLLLAGCFLWARQILQRATRQRESYERVWLDFRDWFGILWTRRVMDRLNQSAQTERWHARLSMDRIQWEEGLSKDQRDETEQKMDHAFRWLFRRFVDESWIDERLSEM